MTIYPERHVGRRPKSDPQSLALGQGAASKFIGFARPLVASE
jgi:hypothetical protein